MKLKGINPLEQHVEQIVLVTVSGIFLLVVASQFLLEPNRVKVANQTLPPGKAFEPAEEKAQRLQVMLTRTEVELPEVPPVNIADQFRQRLAGPVAPRPTLAAFGKGMELDVVEAGPQQGSQTIALPDLPAPTPVAAAAYRITIDPTEAAGNEELKKYLPAEQPLDAAVVSVEATLSGPALRSALGNAQGEARAMPEIWWSGDRTMIMGVRLERQELDLTGKWTSASEVPPPPGRFDGVAAAGKASGGEIMDVMAEARASQEDLMRPAFYRTIAGPEWAPPSETIKVASSDDPQVARLLRDRRAAADTRSRLMKVLDMPEQQQQRQPGAGGGGGGGGGVKGGAGGVAPAPSPTTPREPQTNVRRQQMERQLQEVERKIQDIDSQLRALGRDETGAPIRRELPAGEPGAVVAGRSLLAESQVRIWSHDLTAEPGKTYRYRVKVALNNPAFGRSAAMVAEQHEFARQPVIWTNASDWSAPVAVPADRYFFITSASEASTGFPARAHAEVYQFFYGYYRKGSVGLEVGDTIVANVKLPEAGKLLIWDVTQPEAGQPDQPQVIPMEGPGGGGRGIVPAIPGRGTVGQPDAPTPQQEQLPPNAKPWDKPVVASEDVILLDVARRPGASSTVALMRNGRGEILQVVPDQDPTGMQKLVAESAKAGENQGQPVLPPPEEVRQPQVRPPQTNPSNPRAPMPEPGGGGG